MRKAVNLRKQTRALLEGYRYNVRLRFIAK